VTPADLEALRPEVAAIARDAGRAIMAVYAGDFVVERKADRSPLTEADLAAHRLIVGALAALTPELPVLSEESAHVAWSERREWRRYWLVDPLDGTREFVKRNGEFTVNIALVERGAPVLGVVHAPARGDMVHAVRGGPALRETAEGAQALRARGVGSPLRVAGSRSHGDPRLAGFLDRAGPHELLPLGSSLKFCLVAGGEADVYLRYGATSEWDTAAGQCIVESAGGAVTDLGFAPLAYNRRESLLNPDFVAVGDPGVDWRDRIPGP
jgi:3'(2'), 5'-bisphosphate nucleotidase